MLFQSIPSEHMSSERFKIYTEKLEKLLGQYNEKSNDDWDEDMKEGVKYFILAYCYYMQKEYEKAEEFSRKSVEKIPYFDQAFNVLCISLYRQEKFEEALLFSRKAAELEPDFNKFCGLGLFCFYTKNYDEGIDALKKAVEMNAKKKHKSTAYWLLGLCYEGAGMKKESELAFEEAHKLSQ